MFFDECVRRYTMKIVCADQFYDRPNGRVSIFLINRQAIFCLPVSHPYSTVENCYLDGEAISFIVRSLLFLLVLFRPTKEF